MSLSSSVLQAWKVIVENKIGFHQVLKKTGVQDKQCLVKILLAMGKEGSLINQHCLSFLNRRSVLFVILPMLYNTVNLLSAGNGLCTAEMTVCEEHTNIKGTLHGGLTATLVDAISGVALSTLHNGHSGVSVDMHITFLNPAPLGEEIIIDAKTNKSGKSLAFLEVLITQKSTGVLVAKGSHTKFVLLNS